MDELWEAVRSIPSGRCASYGAVGRALSTPLSGYEVGRRMASVPPDLPWWRVVGKDGALLIGKRDPRLGQEQRQRLEAEGVTVTESGVDMSAFGYDPDEESGKSPSLF